MPPFIFRQLFDADSSTFTYLIGDGETREAILIDPVDLQVERDLSFVKELDLNLKYAINTHAHADHITGTGKLKQALLSCQSVISRAAKAKADLFLDDGDELRFGQYALKAISTPGHTEGLLWRMVLTHLSLYFTIHRLPFLPSSRARTSLYR